jgi:dihydrolipoamide dehydrogenase
MVRKFDILIVGSGAGLNIAGPLASQGQRVAIIEQGSLGGTCLNRGCIPSKMLIHSADVVEIIKNAHLFGIKVPGYEVDFPSIVKRVTDSVDEDSREIEESFKGIDNPVLFKGECRFVGNKTVNVGKETISADKILIATGGRPVIPEMEGLEGSGFITSDEALRLKKQPRTLTILGGGYIAAEMAHFFGALGTRVNIVEKHDTLIHREDEEIAQKFTAIFQTKYNVLTGHEPVKVAKSGDTFEVTLKDANGKFSAIRSDQLLVATGRRPNSDGLDLEKTGVKTDQRGFIIADEYLETNVKGIFSLGDVLGHYLFRHSANLESEYDFYNMLDPQRKVPVDYTAMPHAIFSSPQIAGVGKTEQELRAEKADFLVGKQEYIDTAMGKAIEDRSGFVKILVDKKTKRILGCHIMGTDASVLIHEVLVAMRSGDGSVGSITRTTHIHPAMSEVIQRAAGNLQ